MYRLASLGIAALLTGCAGHIYYTKPESPPKRDNFMVINQPKDTVWNSAMPKLGQRYFVINNLDRSSGFINVSYGDDPGQYVDCGQIEAITTDFQGRREYRFPAAKTSQSYETWMDTTLYISRRVTLEGRANIVFEEQSPTNTKIIANVRYVLKLHETKRTGLGIVQQIEDDTISFNTGGEGQFSQFKTKCVATGKLEQDILTALQ